MTTSTDARPPETAPDHVTLPPGRIIDIADRGRAFARHVPAPAGRPTVILLHGWGATADLNWFRSYGALSEGHGVVALDHRGHGRGIRNDERFRLHDCADDVAALIRQLDTGPCIVVGYSMGGTIAQLVWRRHPELVRGMVLCATAMSFKSSARERAMFASIGPTTTIGRLAPSRLRDATALRIMLTKDDREIRQWARAEITGHDWMRVLEAGRAIGNFDSRQWISGVDVPCAQVMTIDDDIVSLTRQEALAEALPQASLHLVPGGHAACVEDPGAFVPALVRAVSAVT